MILTLWGLSYLSYTDFFYLIQYYDPVFLNVNMLMVRLPKDVR